jgi:hypothetical protein
LAGKAWAFRLFVRAMLTKPRTSLRKILPLLLSEPERSHKARRRLAAIVKSLNSATDFPLDSVPEKEFDDLERLISAVLIAVRNNYFAKASIFKPREAKKSELRFLDSACRKLQLTRRWKDHVSAADTDRGPVMVAQPYGLDTKDFKELLALEATGWRISVDDRWANYFPGHAICILLVAPQNVNLSGVPIRKKNGSFSNGTTPENGTSA